MSASDAVKTRRDESRRGRHECPRHAPPEKRAVISARIFVLVLPCGVARRHRATRWLPPDLDPQDVTLRGVVCFGWTENEGLRRWGRLGLAVRGSGFWVRGYGAVTQSDEAGR